MSDGFYSDDDDKKLSASGTLMPIVEVPSDINSSRPTSATSAQSSARSSTASTARSDRSETDDTPRSDQDEYVAALL